MHNAGSGETTAGVSPDFQVLLHAISSCAGVAVRQILKQNPGIVKTKGWHGQTALHKACLTGDNAVVGLLLENGADPNAVNDFMETPVHYASKRGVPTLVENLIRFGGKVDVLDKSRKSPIHNAAQTGSVYMLQYFEEKGYGFRDLDENLQSPLHFVCSFGHLDAFRYLMRKERCDYSQQDINGNTPLHLCAEGGYAYGSWMLINNLGQSCLKITNKNGYTPLDLCRMNRNSIKASHRILLPLLESLHKGPQTVPVGHPTRMWYMIMLLPTIIYGLAVLLSIFVFPNYQGLILLAALAYIIRVGQTSSHRMNHVSRWASPMHAGLFSAGILHTMLVYYLHIAPYLQHTLLFLTSVMFTVVQLYLYYKLLTVDPGMVSSSILDEKTGKPSRLLDLLEAGMSLDLFCVDCEIVKTKETKHCRLCDRCCYKMDHHCLFLLKCVGYNNHSRFVWFLILTVFVMAMFVLQAVIYMLVKYSSSASYTSIIMDMFWMDCWPLSMALLNIGSIVWAAFLIKYQLVVISKGQTTYFQQNVSTLAPIERLINVIHFLQGKQVFATDFDFNFKKGNSQMSIDPRFSKPVHNV